MGAMVQFRKWDDILSTGFEKPAKPRLIAWYHWARAIAHAEKGNVSAAKAEEAQMKKAIQAHKQANKGKVREEIAVASAEVKGHISLAENRVDKGLKQIASAVERERRLVYTEPPPYPRPAAEALGGWAMRHGKIAIAEKAFKEALAQYPADHHAEVALRALREKPASAGL